MTPRTDPSPLPPGVLLEREPITPARGRGPRHRADTRLGAAARHPANRPGRRSSDDRRARALPPRPADAFVEVDGPDTEVGVDRNLNVDPRPSYSRDPSPFRDVDPLPSRELEADGGDFDLNLAGPVREVDLTEPAVEIDLTDGDSEFEATAHATEAEFDSVADVDAALVDAADEGGDDGSVIPELTVVASSSAPDAEDPAKDGAAAGAASGDDHREEGGEPRSRWRAVAHVAAWATAVIAVAVVLLVFVFPTRTYMAQRRQLSDAASELKLLDTQNAQLAGQVARLRTDAEIERIAREQYHLVRPGESSIAILPPPSQPAAASPAPPPHKPHPSWLHRLTSWIP